MQQIEKLNSDSREYKAESERKTAALETSMELVHTQLSTLISSIAPQRTMDSNAVGGRLTGCETDLQKKSNAVVSLTDKFDQLMTTMNVSKGKSKGKEKALVQAADATASAASTAAADAELGELSAQSQTKSARKAEA